MKDALEEKTLPWLSLLIDEKAVKSGRFFQDSLGFPFLQQPIIFNDIKPFAFRLLIVNSKETSFDGWLDAALLALVLNLLFCSFKNKLYLQLIGHAYTHFGIGNDSEF